MTGEGLKSLGRPATLTCHSNDTSIASVKWIFENTVLPSVPPKSKSSSLHEAIHVIPNVTFNDFGRYLCSANLSTGEVHNVTHELLFNGEEFFLIESYF